jgi:hypothetical protein
MLNISLSSQLPFWRLKTLWMEKEKNGLAPFVARQRGSGDVRLHSKKRHVDQKRLEVFQRRIWSTSVCRFFPFRLGKRAKACARSIFLFLLAAFLLTRTLHHFFAPRVGPIGNGPSEGLVWTVWGLFTLSMILGFGTLFHSIYWIVKEKKQK